ncbi:MAG: hypothetical protein EPO28_13030 [Saprospiraceae bacterium]|nr:MAG: hypothetical protein EPO28_13030 [Saprospiraceae bacterium]
MRTQNYHPYAWLSTLIVLAFVFSMKSQCLFLLPALASGHAISQYQGCDKDSPAEPFRIAQKRMSFGEAPEARGRICAAGEEGVFASGGDVKKLEMMADYGRPALEVLRSVTSVNARAFHVNGKVGSIKARYLVASSSLHFCYTSNNFAGLRPLSNYYSHRPVAAKFSRKSLGRPDMA